MMMTRVVGAGSTFCVVIMIITLLGSEQVPIRESRSARRRAATAYAAAATAFVLVVGPGRAADRTGASARGGRGAPFVVSNGRQPPHQQQLVLPRGDNGRRIKRGGTVAGRREIPKLTTTPTKPHRSQGTDAVRRLLRRSGKSSGLRAEPSREGDEGTGSDGIPQPPSYDETALAREVFANPYFYNGMVEWAEGCRRVREMAFGKATTVREVYAAYFTAGGQREGGLARLVRETGAVDLRIVAYFEGAKLSLEDLLERREVVPLDKSDEVKLFFKRRVAGGVPSALGMFQALAKSAAESPRSYRLCYVVGSSGSGKTFFCLQHLRNFLNENDLPSVTFYLKAVALEGASAVDWASDDAPERLVDQVRMAVVKYIRNELRRVWDPSAPLEMHVCLVIDEAGATRATQRFFDDRAKVTRLLVSLLPKDPNLLSADPDLPSVNLARSASLVVCGTGLLSQTFSSDRDAYYFRMRPWTRVDLEVVLDKFSATRAVQWIEKGETSAIAEAVSSIPLLDALSTNARFAYFMVEGIAKETNQTSALRQLGWQAHLSALVPSIANSVVFRCTDSNGIQKLDEDQRRRVSAWVLGSLSQLEPGDPQIPDFPGLDPSGEATAALLLLQLNVQRSSGKVGLVPGELFSASVTPALAIVLYNMAGVFTNLVSGWRGEEEVTALYAAKRAILERWSKHEKAVTDMQRYFVPGRDSIDMAEFLTRLDNLGGSEKAAYEVRRQELEGQLLAALKEVSVYRLQKQLQPSKTASVNIPIVSKHSILVNGERASFADVLAPYTFFQTKHTSTPKERSASANMTAELTKCCLLKDSNTNDRAVRGLLALWDGTLGAEMGHSAEGTEGATGTTKGGGLAGAQIQLRPAQGSRAYPENLIKWREVSDGIPYAEILPDGRVEGTDFVLPERPEHLNATFVLSTNAERLRLTLFKDTSLVITEESLYDDMQLDPTKLPNEDDRALWASFQNTLVPGTKVQFLFTRSRS